MSSVFPPWTTFQFIITKELLVVITYKLICTKRRKVDSAEADCMDK